MKDTLAELNENLFRQLRRLNADDLEGEKLKEEGVRTAYLTMMATKIIENGTLALKSTLMVANSLAEVDMPPMLENADKSKPMKLIS